MTRTFWLNNPSILLDKDHITELWPHKNASMETKLNAFTRLIILLTLLGFIFTRSLKILISSAMALVAIVWIYKTRKHADVKKEVKNFTYLENCLFVVQSHIKQNHQL